MPSKAFTDLRNVRDFVMNIGASTILYQEAWGDEFTISDIASARKKLEAVQRINMMDFMSLTKDEAIALGFYHWDRRPGLFLLPLWMWWVMPSSGAFETINGETDVYNFNDNNEPSSDSRGGFLGFGVRFGADGTMG
jgi:hypothetical protein